MTFATRSERRAGAIQDVLWNDGNVDLAGVLISKLNCLRICAGQCAETLKPVAIDVEL
jgi:hypothetical protein